MTTSQCASYRLQHGDVHFAACSESLGYGRTMTLGMARIMPGVTRHSPWQEGWLFSDFSGPAVLQDLRNELQGLNTDAAPLKMELAYFRVENHCLDFEAAMIKDGEVDKTHSEGNSCAGSQGGGAGWVFGWSIVDPHVMWRRDKALICRTHM